MKLKEIAAAINDHLKRFERDPAINKNTKLDRMGLSDYFHAGASVCGSRVGVRYISYQGTSTLTKTQAEEYLAWLNSGKHGRHYEQQREAKRMTPSVPGKESL